MVQCSLAILLCVSGSAWATSTYGAPYSISGYTGTFSSVDAALSVLATLMRGNCTTQCPTLYYYYYDMDALNSSVAAAISTQPNTSGYAIWAKEYVAENPEKNLGGCAAANGGKGGALGGSSPMRSSGDAAKEAGTMCPGSNFVGDPINASNGNKYQQDTDFRDDEALMLRRFYNSSDTVTSSAIGAHWRHSFDRSVVVHDAKGVNNTMVKTAVVYRPDGSVERFSKGAAGWLGAANTMNTLTDETNSTGQASGYALFLGAPRETEHYALDGTLQSIVDLSGAVTTLTYSTAATPAQTAPRAGLLLTVKGPSGRMLSFAYDNSGHVSTVTLPDGAALSYAYDSQGNLASVTYPDSHSRTYVYNESALTGGKSQPNAMTGLVDEKGVRFETTAYNSVGRAISASFAGNVDTYQVSYGTLRNSATTPLGATTALNFQSIKAQSHVTGGSAPCGSDCAQPYSTINYDANGWPSSYIDFANHVTSVINTSAGLETQRIEAKNTTDQRTTVTTWEPIWRNPLTRTISNAAGAVVAKMGWAYNARGQVTAQCDMDPAISAAASYTCSATGAAPAGVRRSTMTYCDAVDATQCPRVGLLLSVDGPRADVGDVTQLGYYLTTDESGCGTLGGACHRAGDLAQVTNALGQVTRVLAYDKAGRPVRRQDPNGVVTDLSYSARGWLASQTVRANTNGMASAGDATTTFTYDANGALTSVTDADGVTVTYGYDDAHRLVDVADSLGEHIHYTLDASGNRIKEETFDAKGVSRQSLSRGYNTLGQLVSVTDGLGHVVFDATTSGSYDANGNLVSAKDALGTVQKSGYDGLDRVVSSVANANGTDASSSSTTKLSLDALDQVKSLTDPDGLVTSYGFDGLSNPVSLTSPDTGAQSSTFDTAGNALTQTDAKSTVASQGFDALGRRTSASYTDSTLNAAFHYDEASSVTGCGSSFSVGRLTRVVENAVTTVYCYDNQGRVTEQRQTQGTVTDTTDYVYTKAGRLAAVASPSGLVTEYARDAVGQITKVTVTPAKGVATTVVSAATYLPFGPVASYTLGNGQTIARSYDANYRFTDIVSPALSLHVARDAAGNIVALGNAAGASPATETYTYDPLYRLTGVKSASGALVEAYTYSKTGDRLTKTAPGLATGTYGYQSGTHRLTTIGTGSRTYDANGSTTGNASAGTAWGYGYSGRGQLTVLQQAGTTVATYAYDASAHRIAKTVGSATTRFAYGPGGLLGEYGAASRDYVWMDDTPVAVVDGTTVAFVHADGLDTPRAVTDASGTVLWSWAYQGNPFGEQAPTSTSGYVLNLRFAGQYWDRESGFLYNIHRYYDSTTGRYIQSDPIGLTGGISTYNYVSNNPLANVDPLGLAADTPYKTARCAGWHAVTETNPMSIMPVAGYPLGREYGGWIYQDSSGSFAYGKPVVGQGASVSPRNFTAVPAGATRIGWYHTHGGYDPAVNAGNPAPGHAGYNWLNDGNEVMSPADITITNLIGPGYLDTPGGHVQETTPNNPSVLINLKQCGC
jgi:RHS repeat-associated protein